MKEMIDDFLKNWIIENNIRNTFYAPYHYEAMEAFAKHYHQSKVNNGVLDDVISIKDVLKFMVWLDEHSWFASDLQKGLWFSNHNERGLTADEVLNHWKEDYL